MAKSKTTSKEDKKTTDEDLNFLDELITQQFEEIQDFSKVDTKVNLWYDSGIYSLNYAMSKNLKAGIPAGRIFGIDGLSGTGKSLMVASVMKDPKIEMILIIESEGGGHSRELLDFAGVDPKKVKLLKCDTFTNYRINKKNPNKIEEVPDSKFPVEKNTDEWLYKEGINRALKRLVYTLEMTGKKPNMLIVLDSLGNISTVREKQGIPEVGAKGKDIAAFFRTFDNAFEKTNISFLFTNKVYTNIMDEYNPIKESGGVNVIFNPSVYVRLTALAGSDSDDISDSDLKAEKEQRQTSLGSSFKEVRAKIIKSRFGTENRNAWFMIDNIIGPNKYSGLFTLLRDFKVITGSKTYTIPGWNNDKSFYKKDFIKLVIQNEESSIELFQKLLDEAEVKIAQERKEFFLNGGDASDIKDPVVSDSDEDEEFPESKEMLRAMEADVEG